MDPDRPDGLGPAIPPGRWMSCGDAAGAAGGTRRVAVAHPPPGRDGGDDLVEAVGIHGGSPPVGVTVADVTAQAAGSGAEQVFCHRDRAVT